MFLNNPKTFALSVMKGFGQLPHVGTHYHYNNNILVGRRRRRVRIGGGVDLRDGRWAARRRQKASFQDVLDGQVGRSRHLENKKTVFVMLCHQFCLI